jgi:uncharacterized RDD family membrane protein YckC
VTPASAGPSAPARLWPRLASLAYESILLFGLVFVAAYLFISLARDAQHGLVRAAFQLYLLAACGIYFVYCWTRSGQTLPMKTWGLRVESCEGGKLTFRQALIRYLFAVPSVGSGLGLLWALIDPQGQFLHDRLAGTRIVKFDTGSKQAAENAEAPIAKDAGDAEENQFATKRPHSYRQFDAVSKQAAEP